MHMADALISPVVGGVMWAATAGIAGYSIKKVQPDMDKTKVPMMGVLGAFVFAAQMINFSIPGTGSSGHIGGGMLLASLLGPQAGFLTMMAILLIQCLFFADGGLLAYGANVFNMGFITCFIVFPLVYKLILKKGYTGKRLFLASFFSPVIALQLGAFSVVLETLLSGKTALPFGTFALMMQPIHLAIGVVEGLVTWAVLAFVWKTQPSLLAQQAMPQEAPRKNRFKTVMITFAVAAVVVGGLLSWFASAYPDGLEWSLEKVTGSTEVAASGGVYDAASHVQMQTAFMPDYSFKQGEGGEAAWPAVSGGTTTAGLLGGAMVLGLAGLTGGVIALTRRKKNKQAKAENVP